MSWSKLKDEGNSLFSRGDYEAAQAKYTRAINTTTGDDDPEAVAVLYGNRAACHLNLKSYLDASSDARKATEYNSGYAKAWGRLATAQQALHELTPSIASWEKAVAAMKVKDPSSMSLNEVKQLQEYENGLRTARTALAMQGSSSIPGYHMTPGKGQLPWERAESMKAELMARGPAGYSSSAWVISGAYEEFKTGVETMKALRKIQTPAGVAYAGATGAMTSLTNGILRDHRAFTIDDPNWTQYFNDQMIMEASQFKAWTMDGPQAIKEAALARLRQKGWNDVRPALATTIRGWIMRGFIEGHLRMNNSSAPEFLGRALEVLEWGRTEWAGIPDDQRGAIFQDTFVRGVRCLRLERLLIDFQEGLSKRSRDESMDKLKEILKESDCIIEDVVSRPLRRDIEYDPGFISSFTIYPRGQALSMKGFYHKQMVLSSTARSKEEVHDHFRNAAKYYLAAAETYPEDDEQHAWFLYCALENLFQAGTPLRVTLPIMKCITASMDKMKRIWEHSAMAMGGRDTALQKAIWMEEDVMKALSEGAYTMEDKVMPEPDAWPYGTPWPTH